MRPVIALRWPAESAGYGMLLILALVSLTTPGSAWFEASMHRHMLVQLPWLAVAGALICGPGSRARRVLERVDPGGWLAMLVAAACLVYWMLPVSLDLATMHAVDRLAKVVILPLGVGVCLRWALLRAPPVARIVLLFEIWASVTRLGWLYLESPLPLCSNYLVGEQQQVGQVLIGVSAASGLFALYIVIFGFSKLRFERGKSCG